MTKEKSTPPPNKKLPLTIHFIHWKDTDNTGDRACGFYRYFMDDFRAYNLLIHNINQIRYDMIAPEDVVLLGGGGLLNHSDYYDILINRLFKVCNHVICWSCGMNHHYDGYSIYAKIQVPLQFNRFELIGIRDYNHSSNLPYVPCATCMIEYLTNSYPIRRRIGVISHHSFRLEELQEYDRCYNDAPLQEIIEFIGSSEIIITNSYHITYWATLMQKKVILVEAFSEKFQYMQYPPTPYSGNLEEDIAKAKLYPGALENCRELTLEFVKHIQQIIQYAQHQTAPENQPIIFQDNYQKHLLWIRFCGIFMFSSTKRKNWRKACQKIQHLPLPKTLGLIGCWFIPNKNSRHNFRQQHIIK